MKLARTLAAAAATSVLLVGAGPVAFADEVPPAESPCAAQEEKVAKAEAALARVTAVFENQKEKVAKAREALDAAGTKAEKSKAQEHLAKVKAKKDEAKKAKKAQKQRLAKAEERLAECEAANPEPAPVV
jgi:septal ring factor EnvC (AmiA/AmiB activator)